MSSKAITISSLQPFLQSLEDALDQPLNIAWRERTRKAGVNTSHTFTGVLFAPQLPRQGDRPETGVPTRNTSLLYQEIEQVGA